MDANNSDLERLANRAADYIIATMQVFRNHHPKEFVDIEREKIERTVTRLQRFVSVRYVCEMNDTISFISTMSGIIEYAQSNSETPSTTFTRIRQKAGQVVRVSDDRKRIDRLAKELDDALSLLNVYTHHV